MDDFEQLVQDGIARGMSLLEATAYAEKAIRGHTGVQLREQDTDCPLESQFNMIERLIDENFDRPL